MAHSLKKAAEAQNLQVTSCDVDACICNMRTLQIGALVRESS